MKKKNIASVYITDHNITIYSHCIYDSTLSEYISQDLEPGVISQGYIKKPKKFLLIFKQAIKALKNRPKNVHWVMQDQNLLIREYEIDKKNLENLSVEDHLKAEIGKNIRYPFANATFAFKTLNESDASINISMFIADQDLIEDYLDIFNKAGIRHVNYSVLSSAINMLYNDSEADVIKNTMVVLILNDTITINIIENRRTIFGTLDECNGQEKDCGELKDYIDRIANYYKYNLRDGNREIDNVFVLDTTENQMIKNKLSDYQADEAFDYKLNMVDVNDFNPVKKDMPNILAVAYLSSISVEKTGLGSIEFNINRIGRSTLLANYLLVLSVGIIAVVSLIYIPYMNMLDRVNEQEVVNHALDMQKQMLVANVEANNVFSSSEIAYNHAYSFLIDKEPKEEYYLESLADMASGNVRLLNMGIDKGNQSVEMKIQADDVKDLYEFIIDIYETYGIVDGIDDTGRWITEYPEFTFVSGNTMEVVIHYA